MANHQQINSLHYPFIKITVPFSAGLIINQLIEKPIWFWTILLVISTLALIVQSTLPLKWKWKTTEFFGIVLWINLLGFGGFIHALENGSSRDKLIIEEKTHLFKIKEEFKKTKTGKRYWTEIYQADEKANYLSDGWLYVNDEINVLQEGDIIISNSRLEKIKNTSNPGGYDFQWESAKKGIYFNAFIKNSFQFQKIGKHKYFLRNGISGTRQWIIETLRNALVEKEQYGLAQAILIGYRGELDSDLLKTYTNTGVVHVIAISGLHIGLIFTIMTTVLNVLVGKRKGRWLSMFITLPLIWWFALLTGASASVVRSVLMSSMFIIGAAFDKKNFTMNSLLASAFIEMIDNPRIFLDLGFQLSYTAVSSILIFNPLIRKLVYLKNPLLSACWNMISVTLSAQILTTPLSLYHFQQFPLLFLIANLVAVPLSSLILLTEMMICLTKWYEPGHDFFSSVTNLLLVSMNLYMKQIETIPFSMINQIFVGYPTVFMLYTSIFFFYRWLRNKKKLELIVFFIVMILTIVVYESHKSLKTHVRRIVVLNIPGETCLLMQNGAQASLIANKELLDKSEKMARIRNELTKQYWISDFKLKAIQNRHQILTVDLYLQQGKKGHENAKILIIRGDPKLNLNELVIQNDHFNTIIADGSNKLWKIRKWETEADKLLLRFHSVPQEGPVVMED